MINKKSFKYRRSLKRDTKNISYTSMDAPTNFSILDNRNSIIEYFNTIKRMPESKRIYTDDPARSNFY